MQSDPLGPPRKPAATSLRRAAASFNQCLPRSQPELAFALLLFISSVSALAQADNDHFANRTELVGTNVTFLAPTLAATMEPGEPNHAGPDFQATASIWWNWTAPADGHLLLRLEPGGPGALAIYSGDQLDQLKRLGGTLREFTELVPVTAGTRYAIAVSEPANPNRFTTDFHKVGLKFFPALANDQFAGRQQLVGESVVFEVQRPGATRELGEPVHFGGADERTRWFTWQAPVSGTVSLKVVPVEGGTLVGCRLAAYEGTQLAQLSRVTADSLEQFNAAPFTPLIFEAVAGRVYQLAAVDIMADRGELHYQYPNCRLELSLSQLRLSSPTDGLVLPQSADLTVEVAGPPPEPPLQFMLLDNRNSQGYLSPSDGPWTVESLPAGLHEFRMIVRDGNGRDHYTPKALVRVGLPNDHFANRQMLAGVRFEASLDTRGATFEAGEPAFPGFPQPRSVWFSWTAPADGVLVAPQGPPWDAFTGDSLGALAAEPVFDRDRFSEVQKQQLGVEAGQTYHLRFVDNGWGTPRQGLSFEFHRAPANDRLDQAGELAGEAVDLPVNTWNATIDASEAGLPRDSEIYQASLWYAWTAPERGRMWAVTDVGVVAIHASEPAPIGPRLSLPGPAEVRVEPGQRYLLRLLAGLPGVEGRLSLQFRPGLTNDDFNSARRLLGDYGEFLDNNRFATTEPEEIQSFSLAGHTLWYSYIPPANGTLMVSVTSDPDPDEPNLAVDSGYPQLTVLQGTGLGVLQEVPSQLELNRPSVVGGKTYWIRLDHTQDRIGGRVRIRYALLRDNFNDSFSRVWNIGSPVAEQFVASTWGATREEGEPRHGGESSGASVWWGWSAPANGSVRWWTTGAAKPPQLVAFTGNRLRSLVPVSTYAHDGTNAVATFPTVAGQYYWLVLDYPQAWREEPHYAVVSNTLQFTSMRITSPAPGAAFTQAPDLRISTPEPAWDGIVQQVEYFLSKDGRPALELGQSLGTTRSAPFALQPGVIPHGSHWVTAVASLADGSTRTTEPVLFHLGPPNDALAYAQLITNRAADLSGSLVGTTVEPGELGLNGNGYRGSVWYRWIPPVTGLAELRVEGSHAYGVYRGSGFSDFQAIALQFSEPQRRASFVIEAGVSYWVVVKLQHESLDTEFKFQLAAQSVTLAEPAAGSAWPVGSELQLRAVTGESSGTIAQVEFLVGEAVVGTAGQPPYLTRWRAEDIGVFSLRTRTRFTSGEEVVSPPIPVHIGPTNDAIAFAETVTGSEIRLRGTTLGATPDLGVPGAFQGYPSVWYRWVAPAAGQVEISGTGGSAFFPVIFTVLEGESLPQVPAGVSEFNVSFLVLKVREGVTYWIGFSSAPEPNAGEYDHTLAFSPTPPNDAFSRRFAVTGSPPEMLVNSVAATAELEEPAHGHAPTGASVWWTWTPDSDGTALIHFPDGYPASPAYVAVYTGDALNTLSRSSSSRPPANGTLFRCEPDKPFRSSSTITSERPRRAACRSNSIVPQPMTGLLRGCRSAEITIASPPLVLGQLWSRANPSITPGGPTRVPNGGVGWHRGPEPSAFGRSI